MKIVLITAIILAGGVGGALLGHFGQCTGGACPLTANPWRGAFIGMLIGALFAVSAVGNPTPAGDTEAQVLHIQDDSHFQNRVMDSNRPVLVDFYADWCGPCRMLKPVIRNVAAENPAVAFVKVNVDDNTDLARKYRVRGIPHLVLFRDGKPVAARTGYADREELSQWIEEQL